MVTIQQARQQIESVRRQLEQRRQQIQLARTTPIRTAAELRQATATSQAKVRGSVYSAELEKVKGLRQLQAEQERFEKEIAAPVEAQIAKTEAAQAAAAQAEEDYRTLVSYSRGKIPITMLPPHLRQEAVSISQEAFELKRQQELAKQQTALGEVVKSAPFSIIRAEATEGVSFFGKGRERLKKAWAQTAEQLRYVTAKILPPESKLPAVTPEFVKGGYHIIREHPLGALASVGVGFATGGAFSLIGGGAAAVGVSPAIASGVGAVGGVALTGAYGVSKIKEIRQQPPGQRSYKAGEIVFGEAIPFAIGGYAFAKTTGIISTLGRKELPVAELVPASVISGKKTFPTAPVSKHYELFVKQSGVLPGFREPTMFHQTPSKFWSKTLDVSVPGYSEVPGLYGAYRVSPHFLKVAGGYGFGFNILQAPGKPATAAIIPIKFVKGVSKTPGVAGVPMLKSEVEAVLPLGSKAALISQKFFFKWRGARVPIDIFRAIGEKPIKAKGKPVSVSAIASSYGISKKPSVTPASFLYGLKSSYKPSRVSYKAHAIPSYAPSKPRYAKAPPSYAPQSKKRLPELYSFPSSLSYSYVALITPHVPAAYKRTPVSYKPQAPYRPYAPPQRRVPVSRRAAVQRIIAQRKIELWGKRFGKWKALKTFPEVHVAYKGGLSWAKETLAASFGLKESGKFLKLPETYGFRAGKRESFALVQSIRKPGRLGSFGERAEIRIARNKKLGWFR